MKSLWGEIAVACLALMSTVTDALAETYEVDAGGSLAAAITEATEDGDEIVLAKGSYLLSSEIVLSRNLTVRGATGKPEDVVIAAQGAIRLFTLDHPEARIESVTLANGSPNGQGGAVLINAKGGVVCNCVVTGCVANGWGGQGGAFYLQGDAALVENCVVSNCWCNNNGNGPKAAGCGAIAAYVKKGTIRNSLFWRNGRTDAVNNAGGAVFVEGGLLENCTIAGNYYPFGAGVRTSDDTVKNKGKVRNCLIVGNDSQIDFTGHSDVWFGRAECFENCIAPLYINESCLVAPQVVRDVANGDLMPMGAAVDAALESDWQATATDVAGRARVSGARSDLGCFEVDRVAEPLNVTVSAVRGIAPLTVTFVPDAGGEAVAWKFGDSGWTEASAGAIEHTFAEGEWTVQARTAEGGVTLPVPIKINAVAKTLRLAPGNVPSVTEAYELAADGCVIELEAGDYVLDGTLNVKKGVVVRGETGNPADVTLRPANAANRILTLAHPQSCIQSLMITGGKYADDGGAAYVAEAGGTFSNCVFTANRPNKWGCRGALALESPNALVTHCVFSNNNCNASGNGSGYDAGGGIALYMTAGTVRNSLFVRNGETANSPNRGGTVYLTGGVLENCTVTRNTHTYAPGVRATGGVVRNCIIAGNVCSGSELDGHGCVWYGVADCFENCLTDGAEPVNAQCAVSRSPFADFAAEDYGPGRAALDAATRQAWMSEDATDLVGNSRVQGAGPDLGCYEKDMSSFTAMIEADNADGLEPLQVTFTVQAFCSGDTGIFCEWDWDGDGEWDAETSGSTSHAFAAGTHGVRVRVTDIASGKTVTPSNPIVVTAVPKTIRVDAGGSVAAAVAQAKDGCEVVVAPGTYLFSSEIVLDKNITVRGETGIPGDVVFRAKGKHRLVRLDAEGASLESVTVENGNIQNNTASYTKNGGGFYIGTYGGTVSNCVVRSCRVWIWGCEGDGFYIEEGARSALVTHTVVSNCVSDTSTASDSGNAATIKAGHVRNCLFCYNSVTRNASNLTHDYGTVKITGGTLENCTVVGNRSFNCAGVWATGNAAVRNCAIGLNVSDLVGNNAYAAVWAGDANCFTACIAPVYINGNCKVEAETATYAAPQLGDFTLSGTSAAVEGGLASAWMYGVTDLAGNDRIRGTAPDIGAYESNPNAFSAAVQANVTEGFAPLTVTFAVTTVNLPASAARCLYSFDGSEPSLSVDDVRLEKTFDAPGDYPVRVRVADRNNDGKSFDVPGYVLVKVRSRVLYVDANAPATEFPYDEWTRAATDLRTAVDAAIDGCSIVLKSGEYPQSRAVEVEKGVWIRGETGRPEDVVLRNTNHTNGEIGRILYLNDAGAKVSGLTIKDGDNNRNGSEVLSHGGGVFVDVGGGVVSNCVIRDCNTWFNGNIGGGLYITGGSPAALVTHCVFTNCHSRTEGKNTYGLALGMKSGTVRNCLFVGNRNTVVSNLDEKNNACSCVAYVEGGVLESCTFAANLLRDCAGVWARNAAQVRNCLIVGNETLSPTTPSFAAWGGTASCYDHCLTDTAPINDSCLSAGEKPVYRRHGYRLCGNSPAIDVGIAQPWMEGATDLRGEPRLFGRQPDIGCYECPSLGLSVILR